MEKIKSFRKVIVSVDQSNFEANTIELFKYQAHHSPIYNKYLQFLKVNAIGVSKVTDIPFMPIEFFKHHPIQTASWKPQCHFESSGTTGSKRSRHLLDDLGFYLETARKSFEIQYGPLNKFHFIALLPSYHENRHSSLITMMDHFISNSHSEISGYYLVNSKQLLQQIKAIGSNSKPAIVFGVAFALLDLAENNKGLQFNNTLIMETGGMKGRRKEMIRLELHSILKDAFGVDQIHSEYGMTEILSQCYSTGNGIFTSPPWMKVLIRDPYDPFHILKPPASGGINIIDLANCHSCAFLETEDLGHVHVDGSFQVSGRFDNSEVRGCNLILV